MVAVPTDDEFDDLVSKALDSLPQKYTSKLLGSVAIVYADEPTQQQREEVKLRGDQTLLGLYQGVPLPMRNGVVRIIPDKITLFKIPLAFNSQTGEDLQENVRHTLWHEMAHYFGLDHKRIHELE